MVIELKVETIYSKTDVLQMVLDAVGPIVNVRSCKILSENSVKVESTENLYYIQNTGYCGNFLKFWRPDGHGYTLDLNDAWLVPFEQAKKICRSRPTEDIPILKELAELASQRAVNIEILRRLKDEQTDREG